MEVDGDECTQQLTWRGAKEQGIAESDGPDASVAVARLNVPSNLVSGRQKPVRAPSLSTLSLMVLSVLAGCAEAGPVPHQTVDQAEGGKAASATALPSVVWYVGQRVPISPNFTCSDRSRRVWFRVEGGSVEMRSSRHRRLAVPKPMLAGTVSSEGNMALRSIGAARSAVGRIQGDQLTASDVPDLMVLGRTRDTCSFRYEATRR